MRNTRLLKVVKVAIGSNSPMKKRGVKKIVREDEKGSDELTAAQASRKFKKGKERCVV